MLFNDADELTLLEIQQQLEADNEVLVPILQGLVKSGLLTATEELNAKTDESARIKLNKNFTRFV